MQLINHLKKTKCLIGFEDNYLSNSNCIIPDCPTGPRNKTKRQLVEHYQTTHFGVFYACQLCPVEKKSFHSIKLHYEKLHTDYKAPKVVCDICGKIFISQKSIDCHKKKYHNDEPKFCEKCGEVFSNGRDLFLHINRVHKIRPSPLVACQKCGKPFTKNNFLKHKSICTVTEKEIIQCHVCDKKIENIFILKKHLFKVHQVKHFSVSELALKYKIDQSGMVE